MKKFIGAILLATTVTLSTTSVFAYTDVYTVKPGDTIYRISKMYKTTVEELDRINNLKDPSVISIGQKIYVPVPTQTPSTKKPESNVTTNPPKNGTGAASMPNSNVTPSNNGGSTNNTNNNTNNGGNSNKVPSSNNNTSNNTNTDLTAPSGNVNTTMANQILDLVNVERKKAGVSPLTLSTEVSSVAQVKSDDMAKNGYFDHTSPTYGSPFTMLTDFGVSYRTAGENIAKGQQSAQAVMTAWMNSSGHKANILNPNFKQLGVGYSANNGSPVWVQMFIAK